MRADLWVGMGAAYWGVKDYYHPRWPMSRPSRSIRVSIDAWSVMAWVYMGLGDRPTRPKDSRCWSTPAPTAWLENRPHHGARWNVQVDQVRTISPCPIPSSFCAAGKFLGAGHHRQIEPIINRHKKTRAP